MKKRFKVSSIVPAYNEERNISTVLDVLTTSTLIDEILVVDDGSTDKTAQVVKENFPGVNLIFHSQNKGKADALLTGAKKAKNEILFFCDADLTGLKQKHIRGIVVPVLSGKTRMVVGAQEYMNTIKAKSWYQKIFGRSEVSSFIKKLGGEKVLFKKDFLAVKGLKNTHYGVEQRIIAYFEKNKLPFRFYVLREVGHVHKLKKWGILKGGIKEVKALLGFCLYSSRRYFFKRS